MIELNVIEITRLLIAIIGTGIASYYDIFNRKNVPDLFLYSFLAVSLVINIFDSTYFIKHLPIAGLMLLVFYLMYRIGQLGGADVIVLAAIYSAIPVFPISETALFPSILIVISVATILASIWVLIKYLPKIINKTLEGNVKFNITQILQALLLIFSMVIMIYLFITFPYIPSWMVIAFIILFIMAIFFILYKEEIMKMMVVWKRKVEPEEVIAIEFLNQEIVKKHKLNRLINQEQAKIMNKLKIKWPVLDMPMFLPFIFIGLILYIIIGLL